MIDIAVLRAMAAAGASAEVIISAVELAIAPEIARRAKNAERMRAVRERARTCKHVAEPCITVQHAASASIEERKKERKKERIEKEESKREPTRKRAASPKHELPENWQPAEPLTAAEATELEKMRDWAKANAIRKADWPATWRNWKRRAAEFRPTTRTSTVRDRMHERLEDAKQKLDQFIAGNPHEPGGRGPPRQAANGVIPFAEYPRSAGLRLRADDGSPALLARTRGEGHSAGEAGQSQVYPERARG